MTDKKKNVATLFKYQISGYYFADESVSILKITLWQQMKLKQCKLLSGSIPGKQVLMEKHLGLMLYIMNYGKEVKDMSVWTDFENWRDSIHCGGEEPKEWREAEIGAKYELYDAVWDKVEKVVICTQDNKDAIERSLNDDTNDLWWYRKTPKTKRIGINKTEVYV